MQPFVLEVCVDSIASAVAAQQGGALRIELCASLLEGGLTPSAGTIKVARKALVIDTMVMIRPRGGDFLYSKEDFEIMQRDIDVAKELGATGVVFGILTEDGEIDTVRTRALVAQARPLAVTFHRAFDMVADQPRALSSLIDLGVDRVLTSGASPTALEGVKTISALLEHTAGRIVVMPGGGINESNIVQIMRETGAHEFHMSGRLLQASAMRYRRDSIHLGGSRDAPEYQLHVTSAARVRASFDALLQANNPY